MKFKYLKGKSVDEWLRQAKKEEKNQSNVWKALMKAASLVGKWTAWPTGRGCKIKGREGSLDRMMWNS